MQLARRGSRAKPWGGLLEACASLGAIPTAEDGRAEGTLAPQWASALTDKADKHQRSRALCEQWDAAL